MKKILHILVLPKLAGSQKVTLDIYSSLSANEYEKYVMFADEYIHERQACIEAFEKVGAKIIFNPYLKRKICWSDINAFVFIYKLCKLYKFDIVHTNSSKPGFIGRISAYIAGAKFVVHTVHGIAFHQYEPFVKRFFYYLCEFVASYFCHKIILVNQYYRKYYKFWIYKTTTVYNAIDYSLLPQYTIRRSNDTNNIKLLFVGRLDKQKDPITLLKAFYILVTKYKKKCHLTLIGDGEYKELCKAYIYQYHLENKVSLVGWVDNVSYYYVTHDIFCMPSIYESFGLVFLEAGFYGLPSVATKVEGIPEVIKNRITGLLVEPKSPQEFASKLLYLIELPSERKFLGENARSRVIENYSIKEMTKSVEKIYSEIGY